MNVFLRIKRIDNILFNKITILNFMRIFLEAFSTQFLPMITISIFEYNRNISLLLIILTFLLCVIDVIMAPKLRRKSNSYTIGFLHEFRKKEISKYIDSNTYNYDDFSTELKIGERYLYDFLNDNINQIGYRIIYGIGSLISVFIINYKFFIILTIMGFVVIIIRKLFSSPIEAAEEYKYTANKSLINMFDSICRNINFFVNKTTGENSLNVYNKTNHDSFNSIRKYVCIRGTMQSIISLLAEIALFILWLVFVTYSDNPMSNLGIIFAIRPSFNFFNYLNITLISINENLNKIKEYYDKYNFNIQEKHYEKPSNYCIEFRDVVFGYEENKHIIENFNFTFEEGKIYEIRGPRGVGKSTLLKLIMGYFKPKSGSITIGGIDVKDVDINNLCFFLPTEMPLFNLDIIDNIVLDKSVDNSYFNSIIHKMNIADILEKKVDNLSTGEKKRVALARSFFTNHKIILLDEFNANLDDYNSKCIYDLLKMLNKQNKTIIFINHKEQFEDSIILNLKWEDNLLST